MTKGSPTDSNNISLQVTTNLSKVANDFARSKDHLTDLGDELTAINDSLNTTGLQLKRLDALFSTLGKGSLFDRQLLALDKLEATRKRTNESLVRRNLLDQDSLNYYKESSSNAKLNLAIETQKAKVKTAVVLAEKEETKAAEQRLAKQEKILRSLELERDLRNSTARNEKNLKNINKYGSFFPDGSIASALSSPSNSVLKEAIKQQTDVVRQLSVDKLRTGAADNSRVNRELIAEERLLDTLKQELKVRKDIVKEATKPITETAPKMSRLQTDIKNMQDKTNSPEYMKAHSNLRVQQALGDGGATLFKIQAGLLVNYGLMNSFFNMLSFGRQFAVDLDAALYDLQAITATTTGGMEKLKQSIIDVSKSTKFTAVEVADAAKIMGQAGLSVSQIQQSIEGVVLLATATGSSLADAADTATSVISVFNMRAEDMTYVSNVMTESINRSKLTIEKLSLGLQYAGNIAAESGVSFEETTAILAAMSNAGIKSGSTLGTGLRQIFIEFQNPSEKFRKALKEVGLTLADVDVKSKGFVGVLETLRQAGFDSQKAFEAFEVRSAAAFAAMQNNPEMITQMLEGFLNTNAAVEAAAVQMGSLSNQTKLLQGNLGLLITDLSGPLTGLLKELFSMLSNLIGVLREWPTTLSVIGTGLISVGTALAGLKIVNLIKGLGALKTGVVAFNGAATAATAGAVAFRGSLAMLGGPLGVGIFLVTSLVALLPTLANNFSTVGNSIKRTKETLEEQQGDFQKTTGTIITLDDNIDRLTSRFAELEKQPITVRDEIVKLNAQFGELGLTIKNGLTSPILEVITALQDLRKEINKTSKVQVEGLMKENEILFRQQAQFAGESKLGYMARFKAATVNMKLSSPELTNIGKGLDSLSTASINGKDPEELQKVYNKVQELKNYAQAYKLKLATSINELEELEQKQGTLSGHNFRLLQTARLQKEELDKTITEINSMAATAGTQLNLSASLVEKAYSNSDWGKAIKDKIDNYAMERSKLLAKLADKETDTVAETEAVKKEIELSRKKFIEEMAKLSASDVVKLYSTMSGWSQEELNFAQERYVTPAINAAVEHTDTVVKHATAELDDASNEAAKSFKSVLDIAKEGFDSVKESYDEIGRRFQSISQAYKFIPEYAANQNSPMYGKYNDAEITRLNKQEYQREVDNTKERLSKLPGLIAQADSTINANGGSASTISTTQDGLAIRDSVKGHEKLNQLIKQRNQLAEEQFVLQAKYNAMIGEETEKHMDLSEQLEQTITDYKARMDVEGSWAFEFEKNVTSAFDGARESFSDFVYSVATGSESAGDSIKKFASSVLSSMLKMATNKLAAEMFGMLLGSFGGSVSSKTVENPNIAGTSYMLNTGGYVRMASGGAMPGRDSVKALLRPGEYVLRNQAVEAIGRDNLDVINALGARTISNSNAGVVAAADSPRNTVLNVYVVGPEEKTSLTKNDVLVTISEDLARGGITKKLVKSIMVGG